MALLASIDWQTSACYCTARHVALGFAETAFPRTSMVSHVYPRATTHFGAAGTCSRPHGRGSLAFPSIREGICSDSGGQTCISSGVQVASRRCAASPPPVFFFCMACLHWPGQRSGVVQVHEVKGNLSTAGYSACSSAAQQRAEVRSPFRVVRAHGCAVCTDARCLQVHAQCSRVHGVHLCMVFTGAQCFTAARCFTGAHYF